MLVVMKNFGEQVAKEVQETVAKTGSSSLEVESLPSMSKLANASTSHRVEQHARHERDYLAPEAHQGELSQSELKTPQYVPIEKQLQRDLKGSSVIGRIDMQSKPGISGSYCSIFDGSEHRNPEQDTLHLILYYDEFVVSNPLGNKTAKYSIGAIYYIIGNIRNRSHLKDIHLAMLFPSSYTC